LANSGQADRSFINTNCGYDFVELINKITMSKPFAFSAAALLSPWCRALGIAWLALGSLGLAGAEELQGRVVKVADGDTITVLDGQRQQHVIRLGGIDAPEKSQPYGQKAKAHLSNAVFGQTVTVTFDKRDRYGRILATLKIDGEDVLSLDQNILRRRIGYVIQQIGLFPHMTIAENVSVVPKLLGWDKEKTAARVDE
jgi:energy-coupling factor transporter ATP-binding protein EcfA2